MSYIHLKENSLNTSFKRRQDSGSGLFLFFFKQLDYCMLSGLVLEILYIAELF